MNRLFKISIVDINTPWLKEFSEHLSMEALVEGYYVKPLIKAFSLTSLSKKNIFFLPHYYDNRISKSVFELQAKSMIAKWQPDFLILTSPFYLGLLNIGDCKKIYYAFDNYRLYEGWKSKIVEKYEREIVTRVNLIIVSSFTLKDLFINDYNISQEKIIHLPNATSKRFIFEEKNIHNFHDSYIKNIPKPIAGCIGVFDDKRIDIELLLKLVKLYPGMSFIFVGPIANNFLKNPIFKKLKKSKNVHFIGYIKRSELFKYLWSFDICLLPYIQNDFNYYSCPVRVFDYLASMKPIVSTFIPEIEYLLNDYVYIANNHDEFISIFDNLIKCPSRHQMDLSHYDVLQKHTWESRVKYLMEIIKAL